jgi:hypothetical protein
MGREALLRLGDDPEEVDTVMTQLRARDVERFELECVSGLSAGATLLLSNRGDNPPL